MSTPHPEGGSRPRLPGLVVTVGLVAAVIFACWLVLLLVQGIVVIACYSLGMALLVVPLLLMRPVAGGRAGLSRWARITALVAASVLGAVLCLTAHLVSEHGWLLVVVPAAFVAGLRIRRGTFTHSQPPVG